MGLTMQKNKTMFLRAALAATFCFLALYAGNAAAMRAACPTCLEMLKQSALVFEGKAIATHDVSDAMRQDYDRLKGASADKFDKLPDAYTEFEVTTLYKGMAAKTVKVFYRSAKAAGHCGMSHCYEAPRYTDGATLMIFAGERHGYFFSGDSFCSRCAADDSELRELKASYDAIDALIAQYPQTAEFYKKKAALMEAVNDFTGAVAVRKQMTANVEGADNDTENTISHGMGLYKSGKYEDALKALDAVKIDERAVPYIQLSLLYLGRGAELRGQKLMFSGQKISKTSLDGIDAPGSNFSNAIFQEVSFRKVNLKGSDFTGARMDYVDVKDADISESNFDKASVRAAISSSKFSNVKFINARVEMRGGVGNDFRGSDFSGSALTMQTGEGQDFSNAKFIKAKIHNIGGAKTDNADFTGASFYNGYSGAQGRELNLAGQNLDGSNFLAANMEGASFKGASLKGAEFVGANVKGADFRGADLSGADFSVSRSQGPANVSGADFSTAHIDGVKWLGASFDCATKFPPSFDPLQNAMAPSDNSCLKGKAPVDYSWEKMLQPPEHHYRLMRDQDWLIFKNADFSNGNFEGIQIGQFEDVNLKGANLRYTTGSLDIGGGSLEGADLSYSHLHRGGHAHNTKASAKGAKLFCAVMDDILDDADFSQADWTGAILRRGNYQPGWLKINSANSKILFGDVPIGPADFSGMDFSGCDLTNINFGTADLSNTKFKGAYLRTTLTKAKLDGADFNGARISSSTSFPEGFDKSKFKLIPTAEVNENSAGWAVSMGGLTSALSSGYPPPTKTVPDFPGEDLSKLSLFSSWMPGSNMKGAKMHLTDWRATNFEGANLSEVDATGAVFFDSTLDKADLTNADLTGADLRFTSMEDAKLDGAKLKNALYNDKTVWPDGFDPAKAGAYFVKPVDKRRY